MLLGDPDFVLLKRYGYSIEKTIEAHPDGCTNRLIAQALGISEEDVDRSYALIVSKLQTALEVSAEFC